MNTATEHRSYMQAEIDAAVVEYLNSEMPVLHRPRWNGTAGERMTGAEVNDYVADALKAGRIIEIPGDPYIWKLA